MSRRGFTLIETLIAVVILGILANIAVPVSWRMRDRATAAAVVADLGIIREALLDYYAGAQAFPRTARWGTVPSDLVASLPDGFSFRRHEFVRYRWVAYGNRRRARTGREGVIRARVTGRNRAVITAVGRIYRGSTIRVTSRNIYVYLE